jgi:hypothetical protein
MFGVTRTNSEGKVYSPRDVAEAHIIEDLGFIPTVEQYLGNMVAQPWMSGTRKTEKKDKSQFISFEGKVDHD